MHRILIYDDDRDILDLCTVLLQKKGYEVVTRDNCEAVIQDVEQILPNAILMDNWMPGLTGAEATVLLKQHEKFKGIPVIFFSANTKGEQTALDSGAEYFLQKPFDITALTDIVNKALCRRPALSAI